MNALPVPLAGLADILAPIAADAPLHDDEGSEPYDGLARLHLSGLLGLAVPAALGGAGAGLFTAARAVEQVGEACPATALIFAMHLIRHAAIHRNPDWPQRLRALLARDALEQGGLINALRVEPELGSPTRGGLPATVARLTPAGWEISGRKRYATGARVLSWMEIFARTDEDQPRIGNFLVPAEAPGVHIVEAWNHLGLRGSGSHDVVFDRVIVPEDHAIGLSPPSHARGPDALQMAWNNVLVPAVYTGVARAARAWTIAFLRGRVPSGLGAPLATLPSAQEAIGRVDALIAANARIAEALARAVDAGDPPNAAESGLMKVVMAENAVHAVERCTLLAGNHAHDRANPLERHWRDVQCARVHAPAPDQAHLAAGRLALAEA